MFSFTNFITRRLVLLSLSLVVLIILVIVILKLLEVKKINSPFNDSQVIFSSETAKIKYGESIKKAFSAQSKEDKGKALSTAFLVVSVDYDSAPTPEKRQLLTNMNLYMSKNFSDLVTSQRLEVPCREEACGAKFVYSDSLTEIKKGIIGLETEEFVKEALLHNLENASLSMGEGNNVGVYSALRVNFEILQDEWKRGKNEKIKSLSEIITNELKKLDQERYDEGYKRGFYSLDK